MFSELSRDITKSLDNKIKKEQGIYFSPKNDRQIIFDELKKLNCDPTSILEPSCGSCEFIDDCLKEYPNSNITGIEYNDQIYEQIKCKNSEKITILNQDALLYNDQRYPLILGNPPYFVVTDIEKEKYSNISQVLVGKMNIYIYFMYHCIVNLLENDGYLAFIVPASLTNCVSYNILRKYIYEYCTIHSIINTGTKDFLDTDTNTIIIILQKKKSTENNFIINWGSNVFFSEEYKKLEEYNNKKTLKELGVCIKTGSIVWNQVKEYLTNDNKQDVLIYDTNFKNNELEIDTIEFKKKHQKPTAKKYRYITELVDQSIYGTKWTDLSPEQKLQVRTAGYIISTKWTDLSVAEKKRVQTDEYIIDGKKWSELDDDEQEIVKQAGYIINDKINDWNNTLPKKQYISIDHDKKKKPLEAPIILLNRGHGNTTYTSKCILLDENYPNFYAENHVYVLTSDRDTKEEQYYLLEKIYNYLQSDTYSKFIRLYVGNGAISKKELEEVFPIVISDV